MKTDAPMSIARGASVVEDYDIMPRRLVGKYKCMFPAVTIRATLFNIHTVISTCDNYFDQLI